MFINNNEYNLLNEKEAKKYFELLLISKYNKFPFLTNMLLTIADIEDVHEKHKKTSLAYTYYDHQYERIKIRINYSMIQNSNLYGKKVIFDNDMVLFLIYHELMHNYFYHFSRHEKYNQYHKLTNIVEDYYCNEFLLRLFANNLKKDFVKSLSPILHKDLLKLAYENCCGNPLPFENYENRPLEHIVIEFFLKYKNSWKKPSSTNNQIDENNLSLDGDSLHSSIDNHKAGEEYTTESLNNLNKKRSEENKQPISKGDAIKLSEQKIEQIAQEALNLSNKTISHSENDIIRFKKKITKKDPFLNYVKIKNTLNRITSTNFIKTYAKPNRKKQANNTFVFKGRQKDEGLHLVVGVDVSGSITDNELTQIYNMLGYFLLKKSKEVSIDIFYWSSCELNKNIHFHKDIRNVKELLELKIHSSGGTVLQTAHDFLDKIYSGKKICFLNISDGFFEKATYPICVKDYYFCLTSKDRVETIKNWYPKSIVKNCKIYE